MKRLTCLFLAVAAVSAPTCTIFVVSRGGQVLAAANEDMVNAAPYDRHWVDFKPAKDKGDLGYITFGYSAIPLVAQAGMNEAGLFYDYNALPKQDKSNGKAKTDIFLAERILAKCKSVAEAVKAIEQVDWVALSAGQMVIGDASGASAIIERNAVTYRGKDDYQIGTNFRTSETPKDKITCWRYQTCDKALAAGRPVTVESVRQSMQDSHPKTSEHKTWYTTICDLKAARVFLFRKQDHAKVVVIDLKKELAKGKRRVDMDTLMAEAGKKYVP